MLSGLSIRKKLILLVCLLLVSLVFTGLFAIVEMRAINAAAQDTQAHWLPSIRAISEMRVQSSRYRAILRDHLLIADEKTKSQIDKSLEDRVKAYQQAANAYEPTISSAGERQLFNQVAQLWQAYRDKASEVIALSRKGENQRAIDVNTREATPPARTMDDVLSKIVALNDRGANASGQAAKSDYDAAFLIVLGALMGMVVLGAVAATVIVRDVTRGIGSITASMRALVAGDLTVEIPHRDATTEIGTMADSLQIFKDELIAKKATEASALVDATAKIDRGKRVDRITRDFESTIGTIVEVVSTAAIRLEASAATMTSTVERSQQLATVVSASSEEAASNVNTVAAATEEMASSVDEISRQVQESARIASEAVAQATKTNARVSELSEAAGKIGDVVALINNIASQTNLLALNATIEAARAGEAGKGFAVVASEVKALAQQTARATGEISQQISAIQLATDDSVVAIKEIGGTIGRISEVASAIAAAVEEQGVATREISRNVQQAAGGTTTVSSGIGDLQRESEEAGSVCAQVFSEAKSLSGESDRLKREVINFLNSVRVA